MAKKILFFLLAVGVLIDLVSSGFALEKEKLGSAVKEFPPYYMVPLAAEEKGFWKENGLEVEWVPFLSGAAIIQAVAAGDMKIGMHASSNPLIAAERGLPVVMVADLVPYAPFILWARADSPYRHPRDLKGKRVGVVALGSATHAIARLIVNAHGIEKEVKFIGAGAPPVMVAGLQVGSFEAMSSTLDRMIDLKLAGKVRELASSADYVPKPWTDHVVFARKDFARSKPDVVRRMLKAMLQATDFIGKNPRWAINKMKSFEGFSEEGAKLLYEHYQFTINGRLDRKVVENLRRVFIDFGLITEKAPAVDELFTNEYVP